jgi:leucyl aminopeptidase
MLPSRMTVTVTDEPPVDLDVDLLLLPFTEDPPDPVVDALADTLGGAVRRAAGDFSGEKGETLGVYPESAAAPRACFVGLGPAGELDAEAVRVGIGASAAPAHDREAASVACLLPAVDLGAVDLPDEAALAQAVVEGFLLAAYRYRRYKTDDGFAGPDRFVVHAGDDRDPGACEAGATRGRRLAEAACTARDLVNRSPDEKTARQLAAAIEASGAEHGYAVETWDEERIEEENLGGLLAVNRGSFDPPTFSILRWNPDDAVNERPVVLAGKGVVFDTGGLSLKDTKGSMDLMKSDMAGAAAVVGAFEALADLGVRLSVVGLVPATDNRPGRRAYVPGDVIRMHSGTTVEVRNTDAEGRLLLADALSLASGLDPELVVDLATLTGSCIAALGRESAGVMTGETDGAAERLYAIQRAGERTGERVHPLPMYDAYEDALESSVADLKNVGGRAGAITAAKFLEHFAGDSWMHLDIAGPAFLTEERPYRPVGGTGFGVRLLLSYLGEYVTTRKEAA